MTSSHRSPGVPASDRADAVDVALHEVPAEPGRQGRRPLEVDPLARPRAEPSADRSNVSFITSAVNTSPSTSTTVRQTPLTAIESPWRGVARSPTGRARRARAASPCQSSADDLAQLLARCR